MKVSVVALRSGAAVSILLAAAASHRAEAQQGQADRLPDVVVEQREARPGQPRRAVQARPGRARAARARPVRQPVQAQPVVIPPIEADFTPESAGPGQQPETAFGPVDGYVASVSATATKTDTPLIEAPQSISVVPREQLDAQNVTRLGQAIAYTPGAQGDFFGTDTRLDWFTLRGFNQTFEGGLYRDGLQLRSSSFSILRAEPYGAERIEIFRGPASVLYGQGGPGGIVNFVSKRPTDYDFREVSLSYGSYDNVQGNFDLSGPMNENKSVLYRFTGFARDSENQVDFVDDDRYFFQPGLTIKPNSRTSWTVIGDVQIDRTGDGGRFLPALGTLFLNPNGQIPVSRFTSDPNFDKFHKDQYGVTSLFEHKFGGDVFTLRQNSRYAKLQTDYETLFPSGFLPGSDRLLNRFFFGSDNEYDLLTTDTQLQAKFATGPVQHTMLFGVDYLESDLDDKIPFQAAPPLDVFDPQYFIEVPPLALSTDSITRTSQTGVYGQEQMKLFDRLVLNIGGRYDWVDQENLNRLSAIETNQKNEAFTGRAGAVYLFDNGLAPYVSYSESFFPLVGTDIFGRPFDPTTGQQYEVGAKFQPQGWKSSVTFAVFDLKRQNVLTPDPNNPLNSVQLGEVTSKGYELEARASLMSGLDLIAAYTNFDLEVTESFGPNLGKQPTGVATELASLWLDYTVQGGRLKGFGLGGGVRYLGDSAGDTLNTFFVPDVTLYDATAHYEHGNWRFAVNAQNLFDETYVAQCSSLDACFYGNARNVVGKATYRW